MARYVLLADYQAHKGGSVLDESVGDGPAILSLLASGAPIVPSSPALEAAVTLIRNSTRGNFPHVADVASVHAASQLADPGGDALPSADLTDGAIHLYVASTGDDDELGDSAHPIAAAQEAVRRICSYPTTRPDVEFVVHLAADVDEDVLVFGLMPRRRVTFRGEHADMTVLRTGDAAATSTSLYLDRDGGAAFAVDAYKGKTVRVLNAGGATVARAMVRNNTASRLYFCQELSFAPDATMTFEVVEPVAQLGVTMTLPWSASQQETPAYQPRPLIVFQNVHFTEYKQAGGAVSVTSCETDADVVVLVTAGGILYGGMVGTVFEPDPVMGISTFPEYDLFYGCGLHIPGTTGSLFVDGAKAINAFVLPGFYFTGQSFGFLFGGASHGGTYNGSAEDSVVLVGGGGYSITDARFLVKGMTAYGLRSKNGARLRCYGVEFDDLGPSAHGIVADDDAHVHVDINSVLSGGAADIPGIGMWARSLSRILVNPTGTALASTGAELQADDETGAHGALQVGVPLLGGNGSVIARQQV